MITLGNQKIKDVFMGSQPIKAIYQGANLIWQRITKVLRTVTGGTSVTLTDVNDSASLVLLEMQGASGGSGDLTPNGYKIGALSYSQLMSGTITNGIILDPDNGNTKTNANYWVSDYIWMKKGTYTFATNNTYTGTSTTTSRAFKYDANKGNWSIVFNDTSLRTKEYKQTFTLDGDCYVRYSSRITDIDVMLYESNKTPISLNTYIGSTPLASGERVLVDFENKSAMRGTTDISNLNQTLLNAEQTTFDGTTVLTDTSTNKVSGIKVDYYASK